MGYEEIEIMVPEAQVGRILSILGKAEILKDGLYDIFIDDILTAMENRLKVLKV